MADVGRELEQLSAVGYCVVRDVIPADRIEALREHVVQGRQAAQREYKTSGGSLTFQRMEDGRPGTNVVAYVSELAPYLADERILAIAHGALDPRVRIAQIEFKFRPAGDDDASWRYWHTDWPHDLKDNDRAGFIRQPFPDLAMALTTVWMLSPYGPGSGGTWVVPGTHRNPKNPRNPNDGIDDRAPLPGEGQLQGDAGGVIVLDSRIWHSQAYNPSSEDRIAMVVRYAPWWLSAEYGGRNRAVVPASTCAALPAAVRTLFRHRAEGVAERGLPVLE